MIHGLRMILKRMTTIILRHHQHHRLEVEEVPVEVVEGLPMEEVVREVLQAHLMSSQNRPLEDTWTQTQQAACADAVKC